MKDEPTSAWKQAVDQELIAIQSTADSYATPAEAVRALIDWHVAVARDAAQQEQK